MNNKLSYIVIIVLTFAFAGCGTVVPKPSSISLESAMQSVGTGLRQMREAEGDLRTGLIADEVTVTFNISASEETGGKLSVEMTPVATTKAGAEVSAKYGAQRGNQITIKFKNIMTADTKDTLIPHTADLENLVKIYEKTWGKAPDTYFLPIKSPDGK